MSNVVTSELGYKDDIQKIAYTFLTKYLKANISFIHKCCQIIESVLCK